MRRGLSTLIACAALASVTGCGSSHAPASSSTTGSTTSPRSSSTPAGTTARAGLTAETTPKFAAPEASAPVHSGTVHVAYRDIAIAPDTLRVKVGTTISWRNYDPIEENVTSESGPQKFASGRFGEGGSYQITALRPGVIHYESTLHPASMNGTIEVVQ
jgi:plastocyanin